MITDEDLDRIASGELGVGPSVGERLIAQARTWLASHPHINHVGTVTVGGEGGS